MNSLTSKEIVCFIEEYYNGLDIVAIMLTGSYADQTNRANSDIDIIVVSMIAARQTHENIIKGGIMYQVIVFPYYKIATMLYEDYVTNRGVFYRMFIKGVVLKDYKGQLTKIKKLLQGCKSPANSEQDILRIRRLITNEIENIQDDSNTNTLCSAIEIVRETSQLITGKFSLSGKHLDKAMEVHKQEQKLLYQSFTYYLENRNGKQFSSAIEELIRPFGGFLEKYTTGYEFNVPHENYVLVCLPECTMNNKVVQRISQYIIELCKSKDYFCIVFYEGQNQLLEQGIFLFIYSDKLSIQPIISKLDEIRLSQFNELRVNGIYLSYPYQSCFYEGTYFGGPEIFGKLIPYFSNLTAFFMDLYYKCELLEQQNVQRSVAVKTLYYFTSLFFDDLSQKKMFLFECLQFFLPDAVDVNGVYNLHQLPDIKKEVLHLHKDMYNANERSLYQILEYEDTSTLYLKTVIASIVDAIKKTGVSKSTKSQIFYTTSEYILNIHVVSHLFSIYQLTPHEKFSLTNYILKLLTKDAI